MTAIPEFSIVTTVYKSKDTIFEFIAKAKTSIEEMTDSYELLIVDDGCPEDTFKFLKDAKIEKVKLIKLSRNHGHHRAIYAGLDNCLGQKIFLIDSDLQEDPKYFSKLNYIIDNDKNLQCVYGVDQNRSKNLYDLISLLYYKFFNWISDKAYQEKNLMTFRIMTRKYVDTFLKHKDKNLIFAPVMSLGGFNTKSILMNKNKSIKKTYKVFDRYKILINGLLMYSSVPLYFVFYFGISITMISIMCIIYLLILSVITDSQPSGWTSLILSVWLIGGILSTFLGLIAIYINYIFMEVKPRPLYIVEEMVDFTKNTDNQTYDFRKENNQNK